MRGEVLAQLREVLRHIRGEVPAQLQGVLRGGGAFDALNTAQIGAKQIRGEVLADCVASKEMFWQNAMNTPWRGAFGDLNQA